VGTLSLTCTASNTVGSAIGQAIVQVVPLAPLTPVITAPSQVNAQSSNNLASVPTQANCTYSWTISGGTLSSGQGSSSISFTAGGAGTLVLGCTVTNSVSVNASAQKNVAVLAPPPPPPPSPTPTPLPPYGSCINGDDIANIVIGWNTANDNCNRVTSYRMRATHTGKLKSVRPFFIWHNAKPGYNLGNGGNIQIQIRTDDGTSNHFPTSTVLATLVFDNPVPVPILSTGNNYYPLLTFPTPATLTAGQLYHIVFTNIAVDPKANYVSLDCLWMWNACSPEQPTIPNTDMEILEQDATGKWMKYRRGTNTSITPCIELDYEDGASQGQGYLGAFGDPDPSFENPKPISGPKSVRQTFTVSGMDRVATAVSVRVRYTSGPSPLTIRVEKADGTLVSQGTVSNIPVAPGQNGSSWAKLQFATPFTLLAGQGYRLVLSAPADTVYKTHTLFKGSAKGYKSTTYFADGYAEFNNGTGWKGWDAWGIQKRQDNDLQFFFEVQTP